MSPTLQPIAAPPRERLESVDALRGIAALYVLVYHVALIPQPNLKVPSWAARYVLTGGTGVTLFFIVSALCLCLSMSLHKQEPSITLRFYVRRIFRIVPLFYFWIVVSWLRDRYWLGVTHSLSEVLLSVFFGFNFVPGKHEGFVWASWTLGVEMVFYLIFPIVFRYVNNWWKSSIFFFVSFLPAVFYAKVLSYLSIPDAIRVSFFRTSFFRQLPMFAFGMLTFFVYERFIQGKLPARIWAYVFVVAAVIGYDALISGRLPLFLGDFYIQGVFYGLLLLGLSIAPLRLIVNPLTSFYGEISYSVYLNHPTLVAALVPAYRAIYALHLPVTFHYVACLSLTLGLLTALSYITFRVIEKPGMRMGRRLIKQIPGH